ncbi:hypothetical protein DA103_23235 [Enterobacter cloacae]|uniref:Uncharacterized protein n=1 Tax=Enterobacter cloacae TaxID=550 RepID=A0A2T4XU14_ENTCL|nr:hypothetical protein AXJ76_24240 [Enterobacter cloacae]PTM33377.1 hypothetical protein DA103_23235 [Enterobacter cloacae]
MFRRSDGNTSISPENIAGQSLSVGFRPLPQTTPARPFRRLYDDDLHACAESWRCRSALTA